MLLSLLIITGVGAVGLLGGIMHQETYGSRLEQYISSRNPVDIVDVERLATEYQQKESRNFL